MSFYETLQQQTATDRGHLMMAPVITACRNETITKEEYIYFLTQAYHHVKHTVPLLKACKAHLPATCTWLKSALDEYIEEEEGHEHWILNDIEACGGNRAAVEHGKPCAAIQSMVAFLYDEIESGNPLALFGMVQVLEGTSVSIACEMADRIQAALNLPDRAMTYLRSHGNLDQQHLKFFESLMNRIEQPADQASIVNSAHRVYKDYADMLFSVCKANGMAA